MDMADLWLAQTLEDHLCDLEHAFPATPRGTLKERLDEEILSRIEEEQLYQVGELRAVFKEAAKAVKATFQAQLN